MSRFDDRSVMALLKSLALGAIAAIAVPYVMRNETGLLRPWLDWHAIHPIPGQLGIPFSLPLFVVVTLFALLFFLWADR